jgi:hypothetical protein
MATLTMQTVCSSETAVPTQRTGQCHNPQRRNTNELPCEPRISWAYIFPHISLQNFCTHSLSSPQQHTASSCNVVSCSLLTYTFCHVVECQNITDVSKKPTASTLRIEQLFHPENIGQMGPAGSPRTSQNLHHRISEDNHVS